MTKPPGANYETVFAVCLRRLAAELAEIEQEDSTKAFMKGFIQGWVRAEVHHGFGPPEDMDDLRRELSELERRP